MEYYQKIKEIRLAREESQAKIAEILGIPQTQYSRYEIGKNEMPIRYLISLCRYWNISPNVILGFES